MSTRTYLSIGDVLTLLREEFPDVTISKIRFLESQGLVNPERSPSGYRKFFDHDVERLRWVLRQQREHFLPLKVIRDRLADGELDDAEGEDAANGKALAASSASHPSHAATVGAAAHVQGAGVPAAGGERPTKADEEAMARILADASRRTARLPEDASGRRGLQVVGDAAASTMTAAPPSAPAHAPTHAPSGEGVHAAASGPATATATDADARAQAPRRSGGAAPQQQSGAAGGRSGASRGGSGGSGGGGNGDGGKGATASEARSGSGSGSGRAPGSGGQGTQGGQGGGPRKAPAHASGAAADAAPADAAAAPAAVVTGASLTAEELSAASGLSVEEVAGLVSFGLIEPASVAGIETFDEDALTVANVAASFRAYGIEARHLRLYRNAVDREIGLIEQVVIPLLRQRNPESRQRALDAADDLGALGQSLRATLLKQALRRHLGG